MGIARKERGREMNSIIDIKLILFISGCIFMLTALFHLRDRSNPKYLTNALFWFLFGFSFVFGDFLVASLGASLAYKIIGAEIILAVLIAGFNLTGVTPKPDTRSHEREVSAQRLGNQLFLPLLCIPLITVILNLLGKHIAFDGYFLFDQKNISLSALFLACILSLIFAIKITGGNANIATSESRRLLDTIGWALLLPPMLAVLGGVFVAAKTGQSIQELVTQLINPESRFLLVVVYCVGMAVFTILMGNAFAAFPVMTAGIAMPFLIQIHHADPAPLVAIGMLSGYCGTLMTPMAANFNIVPAALLELKDKYQVIKVQIPSAIAILLGNILLMYFLVFPS
jgi:uncharacterized membrane protein